MSEGTSLAPLLGPLGDLLCDRDLKIAVAESASAGLLAAALADLPEASTRFTGGVVAYTSQSKERVLGLSSDIIERHGAVSSEVAEAMAVAVRTIFDADVSVAITGVAGPDTQDGQPVGLTYISAAGPGEVTMTREYRWTGGRASNRLASAEAAISLATELLSPKTAGA
jgi:nicotinamide-nucleotide amidase